MCLIKEEPRHVKLVVETVARSGGDDVAQRLKIAMRRLKEALVVVEVTSQQIQTLLAHTRV